MSWTAPADSPISRVERARNAHPVTSRAAYLHEMLTEMGRLAQRDNAGFLAYLIAMAADEAARLAAERR